VTKSTLKTREEVIAEEREGLWIPPDAVCGWQFYAKFNHGFYL